MYMTTHNHLRPIPCRMYAVRGIDQAMDQETWAGQWDEELQTAYDVLVQHCRDRNMKVLELLTYDAFVDFMYQNSWHV